MENEIEIARIVIKIGKREEELTVAQARNLLAALEGLLGENTRTVTVPVPYPVYPRTYPYVRWGDWTILTTATNVPTTATYCVS